MEQIRQAKALLSAAGITAGQDFGSLTEAQIVAIRAEAAVAYERKHGARCRLIARPISGSGTTSCNSARDPKRQPRSPMEKIIVISLLAVCCIPSILLIGAVINGVFFSR